MGYIDRDVPTTRVNVKRTLQRVTREFQDAISNHQSQLARLLGFTPQTVQGWFQQGRISPWGAMAIEKHYPDWPKERLRPDIIDWKTIKRQKPGSRV